MNNVNVDNVGKSEEESSFFTWFSRAGHIVFIWMILCSFYTLNETINHNDTIKAKELTVFKDSCVNRNGSVRHDRWLFGIDVYCLEKTGTESIFTVSNESMLFMPTYVSNLFFGLVEIDHLYRQENTEVKI